MATAAPKAPKASRSKKEAGDPALSPTPTLNELADTSTAGAVVGSTVWFHLHQAMISSDELKARWEAAGLPKVHLGPATARVILRRALEEWLRDRGPVFGLGLLAASQDANGDEDRSLIRVINKKGSDYTVFTIVGEHADLDAASLRHGTTLRVFLHKKERTIYSTFESEGDPDSARPANDVTREITAIAERYQGMLFSDEVRGCLVDAIVGQKLAGVSVRAQGGVYFVGREHTEILTNMQNLVEGISEQSYMVLLGVPDNQAGKHAIGAAVGQGLLGEIREISMDIIRAEKLETAPIALVQRRVRQIQVVAAKVTAMTSLLDMQRDDLTEALASLRGRLAKLLPTLEPDAPAPAADPIATGTLSDGTRIEVTEDGPVIITTDPA